MTYDPVKSPDTKKSGVAGSLFYRLFSDIQIILNQPDRRDFGVRTVPCAGYASLGSFFHFRPGKAIRFTGRVIDPV